MKRSRRRFLTLIAASTAALATRPAASLAAGTATKPRAPKPAETVPAGGPAPPEGLRKGIAAQKHDLEKTLKTIRDYPLEPGSDPAFVLTPMRAAAKKEEKS